MHPTEVEQREGGTFTFDMGSMPSSGTVTAWDPPRRFGQGTQWQSAAGTPAVLLATEWLVETRSGGTCTVRMVMSGFGTSADWDEEIEGMSEGLRAALRSLRLYLTHFAGQRGSWSRAFGNVPGSREQAWKALTRALGLADAAEGARASSSGSGAPELAGAVEQIVDGKWRRDLLLRTDRPSAGLATISLGQGGWAAIQLCQYGEPAAAAAEQQEIAWRAWMQHHFPAEP
jgi:hypothetical protein